MRLVCLECSAAYEAPDNLFGPQPREVRCNRCGYQWTVVAPGSEDTVPHAAPGTDAAQAPALASSPQPDLSRPRPAAAPLRPEPVTPPPGTVPAPALKASGRLVDTLAGPPEPNDHLDADELPRPAPMVEPAAESTRALLANAPTGETMIVPPDPEERRLSHDLDFGETERGPRSIDGEWGTRRVVVILILLIILTIIAAVIFEAEIVDVVPALKPVYEQLGL
jgi:predicted Zn finger-like uncharacterized protein